MSDSVRKSEEGCGASCACGAESSGLLFSPMDRRRFVSLGAYAAAAAALAACAGGGGTSITSPGSVGATVKVADFLPPPGIDDQPGQWRVQVSKPRRHVQCFRNMDGRTEDIEHEILHNYL